METASKGVGKNKHLFAFSSANREERADDSSQISLATSGSRVAQWKRAGPITQRSEDRNLALLTPFTTLAVVDVPSAMLLSAIHMSFL